ncbi:hypothetical protein AVEN_184499-1 [Araneus ventricosus]|uniref:Uncharacterized protein n=1 Tax=Araneus ventricosus TaxID=182803 RepID=A0A4Y2MQP5_ARAVE|nr:hypothetical protein AVEN_114714-1 [Araneus ventricosus]GBN29064.1 hypothetical protein AVEN_184499-1 [Araneus ventricosus]
MVFRTLLSRRRKLNACIMPPFYQGRLENYRKTSPMIDTNALKGDSYLDQRSRKHRAVPFCEEWSSSKSRTIIDLNLLRAHSCYIKVMASFASYVFAQFVAATFQMIESVCLKITGYESGCLVKTENNALHKL